ncbi:hypothetical protein FRB99_004761 [Tulasnella sp. 403]|nr:hypothetical protein FRB99_004761 [Tulasnella sp. 403]
MALTAPGPKRVIAQMFQWNWDSIAAECEAFLGPAGYGYIEVGSPIEHVNGTGWFTPYQPVSYKIISKFGNRDQFASMVRRCRDAGVGVIVDTIFNHMTGGGDNVTAAIAGSTYTHYNYTGIYDYNNFHHCTTPGSNINDWNDQYQLWNCQVFGLADLDTSQEYVRNTLAAYANDLISMGVAGLRLDAAKSIDPREMTQILSKLSSSVYITQEAPNSANFRDIIKNGDYQEFRIVGDLDTAFRGDSLAPLMKIPSDNWYAPSDKAVAFVINHDRERLSGLTYKDTNNIYTLAHVWLLGYNYGTPEVFSGYSWTDANVEGPNGLYGTCKDDGGENGWLCQHRWPAVAGMVGFNNEVQGTDVNSVTMGFTQIADWIPFSIPSNKLVGWGRGNKGFVAINNSDKVWKANFKTQLPDGTYCEVLHGRRTSDDACPAQSITVKGGSFNIDIPQRDAIAIHTGFTIAQPVTITFTYGLAVMSSPNPGENVFVSGSIPELGNWDPSKALPLNRAVIPFFNMWTGQLALNKSIDFEYKYIKKTGDSVSWESGDNRRFTRSSNTALQDRPR